MESKPLGGLKNNIIYYVFIYYNISNISHVLFTGNYSCLVAEFHLHRSIGFHLIQSYLPSILIVSISWVSFWMDVDCVPARVTLGVITLLTVSSQVSGKNIISNRGYYLEILLVAAGQLPFQLRITFPGLTTIRWVSSIYLHLGNERYPKEYGINVILFSFWINAND